MEFNLKSFSQMMNTALLGAVILAAVESQDFGPFEELSTVLSRPYEFQAGRESYADAPQPGERVLKTFCGT